jgi:hypothetical protein
MWDGGTVGRLRGVTCYHSYWLALHAYSRVGRYTQMPFGDEVVIQIFETCMVVLVLDLPVFCSVSLQGPLL